MKRYSLFLVLFLIGFFSKAQIAEPVKWKVESKKIESNIFEIRFDAKIDKGWHIYSHYVGEGGPIPTTFTFNKSADYELAGKVIEVGKAFDVNDELFQMQVKYFENHVTFIQKVKLLKSKATIKGVYEYSACDDKACLPPIENPFKIDISENDFQVDAAVTPNSTIGKSEDKNTGTSTTEIKSPTKSDLGLLAIFIAGFLGGLIALVTPCVFPMIPLTVSFFTKQSKSRSKGISNALLYGISIILIYVTLAFSVTWFFGSDALNRFSTNEWVNIAFFALFFVFAISFFGAFEITLPNSWINKADTASEKGGILGIFFMAFTLSLVSFSCTGPIIGTLLVEAAVNGGIVGPLIGMLGFSIALALPFTLFAIFPGWLNSLPKSGGWLNTVKVSLGFLELALALKFLSNADLVLQAGWLKREVFLAIWIAIFSGMAAYLFGFLKFSHDAIFTHLSIPRFLVGLVTLFFTIYLIPGMFGAPLKLISGFPPPMFYSEAPNGFFASSAEASVSNSENNATHASCPHNLDCIHDYDEAVAYAKEVNKPLMLDFTGWACVNCRKMEENVWSDPKVLNQLRNDFVIVSLYVDEKTALPESEQIEVKIGTQTRMLKTVGNKWSHFQASKYGVNTQPFYVLIDHDGSNLAEPNSYDPDIEHYAAWLASGKKAFDLKHSK